MDATYIAGDTPTSAYDDTNNGGYYSQGQRQDETKELFSHKIRGKKRTFFVDLKESANGKFIKFSEKSNGQKHTILMDAEDFPEFLKAVQEVDSRLSA